MTLFADSSAIVKRYADEPGHQFVRSTSGPIVVSALARVEVTSALWRKHRLDELADNDVAILSDELEADWWGSDGRPPVFVAIAVTEAVLDVAVAQVARHGLRAYDGVQLASAISARDVEPSVASFACFDAQLRQAAVREGFSLVPDDRHVRRRRRS